MDATGSPKKLAGRYEVRQILGQGGMGLVYRAYDTVVRREVAVKTILDIPDPASLQLFYKECDVLASMSHPNMSKSLTSENLRKKGRKSPTSSCRFYPARLWIISSASPAIILPSNARSRLFPRPAADCRRRMSAAWCIAT